MSSAITIAAVTGAATAVAGSVYNMTQGGGSSGGGQVQETAQGLKAANLAAEQYNMYLSEIKPTEEKFIADVMKPTEQLEARERGKINANVAQKVAASSATATPQILSKGLSAPSTLAKTVSNAQIQAGLGVQDKKIAGLQAITDIGEGKKSQALTSMNSIAADAQRNALANTQAKADETGAIIKGIGSVAGAVGAVAKNWPTTTPAASGLTVNYTGNPALTNLGYTGADFGYVAPTFVQQPVLSPAASLYSV